MMASRGNSVVDWDHPNGTGGRNAAMQASAHAARPRCSRQKQQRAPCASKAPAVSARPTVVGCPVLALPPEVLALVLPFLAWQATDAMTRVCSSWRSLVLAAKARGAQWKASVLGPAASAAESLELLRANHCGWADTRFAPNLALLTVASSDSRPWQSGAYWDELATVLESECLLPHSCRVVATFTTLAVLGATRQSQPVTVDAGAQEPSVTLSISVAHLPDTTIEAASFDRKTLRRCHREVGNELDYAFSTVEAGDEPCFLLFGVNDQSASELVPVIQRWHPDAVVVGVVSPLLDRCSPLATYVDDMPSSSTPDSGDLTKKQQRQRQRRKGKQGRERLGRQQQRSSASSRRGRLEFPSTLLLRLCGRVGVRSFASSGYHAVTPVLQCDGVDGDRMYSQAVHYDRVTLCNSMLGGPSQHRLLDLVEPSERFSIEQSNRSINLYACQELEPLEWLVRSNTSPKEVLTPQSSAGWPQIHRLEDVLCLADGVASLQHHWEEGAFGFLAAHFPNQAHPALSEALRGAHKRVVEEENVVLGAFMAAGALSEIEALSHADQVSQLYADVFHDLPLSGCIVGSVVGPVALPGGLSTSRATNSTPISAQVQVHTTCVAIFYEKRR